MRTKIAFGLAAVLVGSLSTVRAAEFWEKKDFRQWSEKECRKLLGNSPWAKQYVLSQVFIEDMGALPNQGDPSADIVGGPPPPSGSLRNPDRATWRRSARGRTR